MRATHSCSKATWAVQIAFLKLPEEYTDLKEVLEKLVVAPLSLSSHTLEQEGLGKFMNSIALKDVKCKTCLLNITQTE
jgi:hypothetical protein